jgi:ATP/maltotriose-dependent transcriptional regulator MalT
MTQAQDIPTWTLTFQLKLMAALDAAWKIIEATNDPAAIREARDKAKAVGELAAMARKVALIVPTPRGKPQMAETVAAGLHAAQGVANLSAMVMASKAAAAPGEASPAAPVAAQAEHARRAFDKLKGGRRGRL